METFAKVRHCFFLLLWPAALLTISILFLTSTGYDIDHHRVLFMSIVAGDALCLGICLVGVSVTTIIENVYRKRAGMRTLGINRYGRWEGGSFYSNQLINSLWLVCGGSLVHIGILCIR